MGNIRSNMAEAEGGLSKEEMNEFREIFNLVDADGSGEISREELGDLIATLGLKASQEELDRMIDEIDVDGDGTINFEEFCSVMSHRVSQTYTPDQVKNAFKVFQGDAPPGYVNIKYLEKALNTYSGDKQAVTDGIDLLMQVDPDGTGYINFTEYVDMMTAK